ncbi:MAG: ArnT family glycosyltransferase [Woeseiaceae bacterium]
MPERITSDDAHVIYVPSVRIFWVLWIVVTAWLLACALLVAGEYADGYQTIANSRYLFGDSPTYYFHRGPLAAIMLWPVEVLANLFNIGPLEVTPYHLYSAALHSLYLLGCWWALQRSGASPLARIFAFLAAISTVVFYAYSPYLSHDILPGLLFLLMIYIANRWLSEGSRVDALLLVIIGAAVVLIKQTYALFWIVIVAYGAMAFLFRWDNGRVDWRRLGMLMSLAVLSGGITWVGYAWFAADEWAYVPWYMRPWELAIGVSEVFGKNSHMVFPADLYLRNLHNFGVLAMLLVIPGIIIALRGNDPRLRMIAICWLTSAITIQFVTFKEVRYFLFLAPLTAVLIVPAIEWSIRRRIPLIAMVLVLAFDQVRGFSVAASQIVSTGTINPPRFFESAGTSGRVVASKSIAFVYDARSPLQRDTYHGIYSLGAQLYFSLHEGKTEVHEIATTDELGMAKLQSGDRVYVVTTEVRRITPYTEDNSPNMLSEYTAIAGRAAPLTLHRQGGGYVVDGHENSYVMLVPDSESEKITPLLSISQIDTNQLEKIYGNLQGRDSLDVTAVIIDAVCRADSCQYR